MNKFNDTTSIFFSSTLGVPFRVRVIKTGTRISIKSEYGFFYVTIPAIIYNKTMYGEGFVKLSEFVEKVSKKYNNKNIFPFSKEYVYFQGKQIKVSSMPAFKNNPNYLYVKNNDEKTIIKAFDKRCIELVKSMVEDLKIKMNISNEFSFSISNYHSIFASISPLHCQIHFDRRICCFNYHLTYSVIAHEMSHMFERNHSKNFYQVLEQLSPNHKKYQKIMASGDFTYDPEQDK